MKFMVKESKKVNATIEGLFKELANIRTQKALLKKQEDKIVAMIKESSVFDFKNFDKEEYVGKEVVASKVPFLTDTHYDLEKVHKLADMLNMSRREFINRKTVCKVNEDKLKELLKSETITQDTLDEMAIKGNKISVKIITIG